MHKFDILPGLILKDDLLKIKEAQTTLAQCVYQYPSGGNTINGKDYVDFQKLRDTDEVREAMEVIAAAFGLNIKFKEV